MNVREARRLLLDAGFEHTRNKASHEQWTRDGILVSLPAKHSNDRLSPGVEKQIRAACVGDTTATAGQRRRVAP